MKFLYEELIKKGLSAKKLSIELAWTIPYVYIIDKLIGTDIIIYKPININQN